MNFLRILTVIFPAACLVACSEGQQEPGEESARALSEDEFASVDLSEKLELDSGEAKMYILPTPLQISAALEHYKTEYNEKILLPESPVNFEAATAGEHYKAVLLGMYVIDIGYTATFHHHQKSLNYLKEVESLISDLNITGYISDGLVERFGNNQHNQDSLYAIILETYGGAHEYFRSTNREGLGLLILTGCYVEGLHLSLNHDLSDVPEGFNQLFCQQKFYLDNLMDLLGFYAEKSEKTFAIRQKLVNLRRLYDQVEIDFREEDEKPFSLKKPLSGEVLAGIRLGAKNIREEILAVK